MEDSVLDTKVLRERIGAPGPLISQAAFAEIAHVDQSSVSLWETDKTAPSRAASALIQQYCENKLIDLAWKSGPVRAEAAA